VAEVDVGLRSRGCGGPIVLIASVTQSTTVLRRVHTAATEPAGSLGLNESLTPSVSVYTQPFMLLTWQNIVHPSFRVHQISWPFLLSYSIF